MTKIAHQEPEISETTLPLLEAMRTAVIIFDQAKSKTLYANPRGREVAANLLYPESPLFTLAQQVTRSGRSLSEYDFRAREGQRYAVHISVFDDRCLLIEISEGRAENRQVSERDDVLPKLAHEIKNPLAGISGAAQLLAKSCAGDDDRELASLICRETARIRRLVENVDLLSAHPPHAGHTRVNIHEALDHVLAIVTGETAGGVTVTRRYDPSLPAVAGDFDQLVQVFLNLIKNAAEAIAGGDHPEITVTTSYDITPRVNAAGTMRLPIVVTVTDNGAGIAPDMIDRIFQPFYTTKRQGTGLGLAIASRLVESHGGLIDARSQPGKTDFIVCLPRHTGGAA